MRYCLDFLGLFAAASRCHVFKRIMNRMGNCQTKPNPFSFRDHALVDVCRSNTVDGRSKRSIYVGMVAFKRDPPVTRVLPSNSSLQGHSSTTLNLPDPLALARQVSPVASNEI